MSQLNTSLVVTREEALAELQRRGYDVSSSSSLGNGSSPFPGFRQKGITIRPSQPMGPTEQPDPRGTGFFFEETQQDPPQRGPGQRTAQLGAAAPSTDEFLEPPPVFQPPPRRSGTPLSAQSAMSDEMTLAEDLAAFRREQPKLFASVDFERQKQLATNLGGSRRAAGIETPEMAIDRANRAQAMLDANNKGELGIQLTASQLDELRAAVKAKDDLQNRQGMQNRAAELGPVGAAALSAANAASLGIGPALRNVILPDLQGLESELAEENPVSSAVGTIAGSAPMVFAGAGGGAALVGRAGLTGTKGVVASAAGRFAGGEAVQAPLAFGQALGQGADFEQAREAGVEAVTSTGAIVRKIASGEELTIDDRINLAFMVLEAAGIKGDIAKAMESKGGPSRQSQAKQLARAIMNQELPPADLQRVALEQMQVRAAEQAPSTATVGDDFVQSTLREYGSTADDIAYARSSGNEPHARFMEEQLQARAAQDAEASSPALARTDRLIEGVPYRIEQLEGGRFRVTSFEGDTVTGQPLSVEVVDRAALQQALGPLPSSGIRDKTNAITEKFFPSKPARVGEAARGRRGGDVRVEAEAIPVPEARPKKYTQKELIPIRKAIRSRKYTPNRAVHTTGASNLEAIARQGLQPTKDADGDLSVSVSRTDESGKLTGGAASYGRGDLPVVLELSDRVQTADQGLGDTFARSEGSSFVRPEDIEGVYIGDDPKRYTLQEAVDILKGPKQERPVNARTPDVPQEATAPPGASGAPDTSKMTVRALRAEAKRLGVRQYDNAKGQPELRRRVQQALDQERAAKETAVPEPPPPPPAPRKKAVVDQDKITQAASEKVFKDPTAHARLGDLDDAALMKARQLADEGSPIQKAIDIQLRNRGITDFSDEAISRRIWKKKFDEDPEKLPSLLKEMSDEDLSHFISVKKHGPTAKALRAEMARRSEEGPDATVGAVGIPTRSPTEARLFYAKQAKAQKGVESVHRIIADLSKAVGMSVPGVRGARALVRSALGFYRPYQQNIRLRMADYIETHFHEISHHLHSMIFQGAKPSGRAGITPATLPPAWHKELYAMGKALYGKRRAAGGYESEGFAELVRLMFMNPAEAARQAPTAHAELVHKIRSQHPSVAKLIDAFRTRYQIHESAGAFERLASYINRDKPPRPIMDRLVEAYDFLAWMWTDRTAPVVRMLKDLGLHNKMPGEKSPHIAALRADTWVEGDFASILRKGSFDPRTMRATNEFRSLENMLDPVKDTLPEWETYMAGNRILEKRKQGQKGLMSRVDTVELQAALDEIEKQYPHFKTVADEFHKMERWLIKDYAVAHGLLSPKQADKIISKNLHYITFKMVKNLDGKPQSVTRASGKYAGASSGVRRMAKFAGEQIEPPLASFVANMHAIMRRAKYNAVGQSIVALHESGVVGSGRWLDKIDRPVEALRISGSAVKDAVMERFNDYIDMDSLDDDMVDALALLLESPDYTFFKQGIRTDKGRRQFIILKNGKPTFWEAKSDNLFHFIEGLGGMPLGANPAVGLMVKLFQLPKNVIRATATTYSAAFAAANIMRDLLTSLVFNDGTVSANPVKFAREFGRRMNAWWKMLKPEGVSGEFLRSGGQHASLFKEYSRSDGTLDVDRLFGRPHLIKKRVSEGRYISALAETAKLPFAALAKINERSELANRVYAFDERISRSKDPKNPTRNDIIEAGQAAADITIDYTRGGVASMAANQFIPFFNASVQGSAKLVRFIAQNPAKAAGRIMSFIIGPSVVAYMMNRDDEAYYKIPMEQRDRYWHIPLGDADKDGKKEWFRIPKPYGLGALSLISERAMYDLDGIDPITGKRGDESAWRGAGRAAAQDFRPPYQVPIVTPLFEMMANHSFFFGGEIVRKGEQHGPKGERGAERSSHLAYALGRAMNIEPPMVDYAIQSMFTSLGSDINNYVVSPLVKVATEDLMGWDPKPVRKVKDPINPEQWWVVKRFLVEQPSSNTENLIRFWEAYDELEDVYRGMTMRKERPDAMREYLNENRAKIMAYRRLRPYKNQMDSLFAQIRSTYRGGRLSDEEIYKYQNELYEKVNETSIRGLQKLFEFEDAGSADSEPTMPPSQSP